MHGKHIGKRKQTQLKNKVHRVIQTIKYFKLFLWKIIVLAAHGVSVSNTDHRYRSLPFFIEQTFHC